MEYLKTSIVVVALILAACKDAPDIHPTVLDTQLDEGRVYRVIDKKNLVIQFSHTIPVHSMNGYYCLSQAEFAAVKKYVLDQKDSCASK